ncbi:MAG: aspartate 1-decarboxylase [Pseudolactococcus laudensis]|jgi:L-aspartate-alpha-decarboxylase|uniref:Aspartate 1-decarboxylase n=2 Tax=Pseudolactococcus chungangensis TaxID=451457 RepID=A0A1K2H5M9_9LACT|nr:aspartate 1-decarboxylase [Lactococcus chungangensis]MBQ6145126.1 aspartate 1-decarboxylase [Lactococcus sp.]NCB80869.1 aspartate 1-decarboxylase [Bacilli bacterium]MBR2762669.1 aspartate 1-decarboxylase [Lactococcus sp.]MDD3016119.1 aspartate 1-decarboxylase [Lactococcus chungangensis]NLH36408.1 aspartate 1-decarboxylase [Lactococcus chungangensis]
MLLDMLKCKIHRATVTQAELDYVGSITIDAKLLAASGLLPYEKVHIVNINNGERFETYVIEGPADTGVICLNGAAARKVQVQDKIIIMAYAQVTPEEARVLKPQVVFVTDDNKVEKITDYEKIGKIGY